MYFDLDDHHPETPTVPPVISRREGVLLAFIAHLLVLIVYLLAPKIPWFQSAPVQIAKAPEQPLTFVSIEPRVDIPKPPKPNAPPSDLDRQLASRLQVPKPENTDPVSQGNTPERVEHEVNPTRGRDTQNADAMAPKPLTSTLPILTPQPTASAGLGDALKHLDKYMPAQNFDNRQGTGPLNSDIQFDSKGIDFGPWLARFRRQVESNWFVPEAAKIFKGHVVIQFYIHRDGSITELHIVQPCAMESFNLAALDALKHSNPTIPLPDGYPTESVLFTVTFFYNEPIR